MSSGPNSHKPEKAPVDAIVLAGTRGAKPLTAQNGISMPKQYLELGGQAMCTRVVRAVLGARGVGRVYVVGAPEALGRVLEPLMGCFGKRLCLVPEGADLLENGLRTFFHYVLPDKGFAAAAELELTPEALRAFRDQHPEAAEVGMLVVTSDMPFVAAADIEAFMAQVPLQAGVVAGMCDHAGLVQAQRVLGNETVLERWKLGAICLRKYDVRLNNLWYGRLLLIDPAIYAMTRGIYNHRYILRQDGKINWKNLRGAMRAFARHGFRRGGRMRFLRGVFNMVATGTAGAFARWAMRLGTWAAWPFRQFVRKRDLEFWARLVFGVETRLIISRDVAPAIDIDVQESYQSLAADGEENYRRLARYLGRPTGLDAKPERPDLKIIAGGRS